jgi:YVTN family beta-propeller protein
VTSLRAQWRIVGAIVVIATMMGTAIAGSSMSFAPSASGHSAAGHSLTRSVVPASGTAVIDTLVLANNTLVPGNYIPSTYQTGPGHYSPTNLVLDTVKNQIWVDEANNTSVISGVTNKVIAKTPTGNVSPAELAFDSVQGLVYQANFATAVPLTLDLGNVTAFSDSTYKSVLTDSFWVFPSAISYDSGTHQIFVADTSGNVTVLNAATGAFVTNITAGLTTIGGDDGPSVYDPVNSELYFANDLGTNVTVISDKNDTAWKSIQVGAEPLYMAYDSGKGEIFVSNAGSANISVINTTTNTVVASIPASESPSLQVPGALAYDKATNQVFVLDDIADGDDLSVISDSNNALTDVLNATGVQVVVGSTPNDIIVDPANGYLYTSDRDSGTISIVQLGTSGGPLSITSFTANPSPVAVGKSTTFATVATGGVSPYSYSYTGLPPGCGSQNTASFACTPTKAGTYTVKVFVNDSASHSVSATLSLTVFAGATYSVTFTEKGLPSGTTWNVILGSSLRTSKTTTITFSEPNSSYPYVVASTAGYGPNPSNGTLTVSGAPVSVLVTYSTIFGIEFEESTLPTGTNWSLTLTGNSNNVILVSPLSGNSLTRWSDGAASIAFYVSQGNYSYSTSVSGYSSGSGTVNVTGAGTAPVSLVFSATPASSSGLSSLDYLLIAVVIVVVVVAVVLLLVQRRRRKPRPGVQPYSPPPGSVGQAPSGPSPPAPPSTSPTVAAAVPMTAPPPPPAPPAPAVPNCATCGRPTTYIAQYSRYYCYSCAHYV